MRRTAGCGATDNPYCLLRIPAHPADQRLLSRSQVCSRYTSSPLRAISITSRGWKYAYSICCAKSSEFPASKKRRDFVVEVVAYALGRRCDHRFPHRQILENASRRVDIRKRISVIRYDAQVAACRFRVRVSSSYLAPKITDGILQALVPRLLHHPVQEGAGDPKTSKLRVGDQPRRTFASASIATSNPFRSTNDPWYMITKGLLPAAVWHAVLPAPREMGKSGCPEHS